MFYMEDYLTVKTGEEIFGTIGMRPNAKNNVRLGGREGPPLPVVGPPHPSAPSQPAWLHPAPASACPGPSRSAREHDFIENLLEAGACSPALLTVPR